MADLSMATVPAHFVSGTEYLDALSRLGYNHSAPESAADANASSIKAATSLTSFMDQQYNQAIAQQKAQVDMAKSVQETKYYGAQTDQLQQELPLHKKQLELDNIKRQNDIDLFSATKDFQIQLENLKAQQAQENLKHSQNVDPLLEKKQDLDNQLVKTTIDEAHSQAQRDEDAQKDLPTALSDIPQATDPDFDQKLTDFYTKHPNAATNPKTQKAILDKVTAVSQQRAGLSSFQEQQQNRVLLQQMKARGDYKGALNIDETLKSPDETHAAITRGNIIGTQREVSELLSRIPFDAPPEVTQAASELRIEQQRMTEILSTPDGINKVGDGAHAEFFDPNGNLNPAYRGKLDALKAYNDARVKQGLVKPMATSIKIPNPYHMPGDTRPENIELTNVPEDKIKEYSQHPEQFFPVPPEVQAKLDQNKEAVANKDIAKMAQTDPQLMEEQKKAQRTGDWTKFDQMAKDKIKAQSTTPDTSKPTSSSSQDANNPNPARVVYNAPVLKGTDERLTDIVAKASNILPAGYKVEPTSGFRTAGQGFHTKGLAQDWKIIRPDGTEVANKGEDDTGLYTQLARAAYGYQERHYPELTGRFAWGGAFGTSSTNKEQPDLMHFDLGGQRGHISRYSREHIGAVMPPGVASAMPVHESGHPMPRSPQEALTLGPGATFRDPNGVIRQVPAYA